MLIDSIIAVIILNLILSIIIIVEDLYYYFKKKEPTGWSKILYAAVGFGWLVRTLLFFAGIDPFGPENINPYILILTTFTLLSMAVGANIRVKRDIGEYELHNDLRRFIKWISHN